MEDFRIGESEPERGDAEKRLEPKGVLDRSTSHG
jgi:hypothetical protein